jgi:hypothetical protein
LWATRRHAAADAPQVERAAPWCSALALVLLMFVGYASWDYWRIGQLFLAQEDRAPEFRQNTLQQAQRSWLFQGIVGFADITTRPITRENAADTLAEALDTLHFSPEPRVIEKVIESATLLGEDGMAEEQLARFRAAFPKEHRAWVESNRRRAEQARCQLTQTQPKQAAASAKLPCPTGSTTSSGEDDEDEATEDDSTAD